MAYTQQQFGTNRWWRHIRVTAVGNTTLLTANGPTAAGTPGFRPVITGWSIAVQNTNAAACEVAVRSLVTTATVAVVVPCGITNSTAQSDISGIAIPMAADEGLQVAVSGALTGVVSVTVEGIWVPSTVPLADKYTGAP